MNYSKEAVERREKKLNSKGTKVKNKFVMLFWRFILVCLGLLAIVGIAAGFGVWKGIIDSAPELNYSDAAPDSYYSIVYADDETTETGKLVQSGSNRKYVPIDEIPQNLADAFVAIEDSRFYEHNGIDLYGIARAFVSGLSKGSFNEGASTITQQLVKNNILTGWTSETSFIEKLQRKIQEQYLAVELEQQVSKEWILESYMNSINLGANSLGVEAAAEKYFGEEVGDLTLSECAVIAGITQNPSAYNPIKYPENNAKRREKVLTNMLEQGYITQEEYDEAEADTEAVYERIANHHSLLEEEDTTYNSYFVDAVIDNVYDDLVAAGYSSSDATKMIYSGGLKIYSTQNLEIQQIVDEEVANDDNYDAGTTYSFILSFQVAKADGTYQTYTNNTMLSYYKNKTGNEDFTINYSSVGKAEAAIEEYEEEVLEDGDTIVEGSESIHITPQPQVAMTIMDQYTGEVLAISGGRGDKVGNRTWNRATDTLRQPGSTFKIIGCYAAALDTGEKTLASTQVDEKYTVGEKTFKNATGKYGGITTIRKAITNSINIVTVKTLQDIGVEEGFEYAEKFGISTLDESDKTLSLCLGGLTNGVSNLELTGAYAAIANGGTYMQPKFYTRVEDSQGNVILDIESSQETHEVISEETAWLLTSAMEDVMTSGTGKKAYFGKTMPQAGKSGTTTNSRDCLFAGYTPYYTCVVWGGYDDNSKQSSTSYPKYLWKAVMKRINEDLPYRDFEMPEGIVSRKVCKKSGLLPTKYCSTYTEYFAEDSVPTATCGQHVKVEICSETGQLATQYCPSVSTKVYDKGSAPTKKCTTHTKEWYQQSLVPKTEENADSADGTGTGTAE